MTVQLILWALALLLRGESAFLRNREGKWLTAVPGWLLALTAVWLAVVGVGGWPPLWPLPLAVALGVAADWWLHQRQDTRLRPYLSPAADLLLALALGLLSLPPLAWLPLLLTAAAIVGIGWVVDAVNRWLAQRLPWPLLAAVGLLPLLIVAFVPAVQDTVTRTVSTRLVYLLPAPEVTLPAIAPTTAPAVATATAPAPASAAAPTATAVLPAPTPTLTTPTAGPLDAAGTQWSPYLEWLLPNDSYDGNPFDLIATATFVHTATGESHTTGMFYDGSDGWRFRFTGTQPGEWTFTTRSDDPELDGHNGRITIAANPGVAGFVTQFGNKWGRTGLDQAFVPQFVMVGGPHTYYNNPAEIEANISTFMVNHGFNGMHTPVFCRWFDITTQQCSRINVADPNPDLRTFAALEQLITAVHANGGVVHIWMWGDDSRSENPKRWGINGDADIRLQRYIAARLGPLPGWTMGYGYDLFEWVSGDELTAWHSHMQQQLGWFHFLGARASTNQLNQLSEAMDYASYEQHRPDYEQYVAAIEARPDKPAFSEDRFRIRDEGRDKDYTEELTRRGLWQSTMAGGVANIWGNLIPAPAANDGDAASAPYADAAAIQTYFRFFANRFWFDMVRCNELTDAVCLMRPSRAHYVFYAEDAAAVALDLSGMAGGQTAVAVDTRLPYAEMELGVLDPISQTWTAPYASDWAIAVGDFGE